MTVVSRTNKNLEPYFRWILETLFTVQLGDTEDKIELACKLAGMSIQDVKAMCSATSSLVSCIYLFEIGSVGNLRKKLQLSENLDDNDMIYKWGRTGDLSTRAYNHGRTYGNNIRLIYKGFIDKQYLVEAEAELRSLFNGKKYKIVTKGHNELSLISHMDLKEVKNAYAMISEKYVGRVSVLTNELKDIKYIHVNEMLEKDLVISNERARADKIMLEKDKIMLEKDLVISNERARADKIMLEKNMEILKLQHQIKNAHVE